MRGVTQWTAKGAISLLLLYKFQRDVKMEPDGATWSRKGVKMDPNRATWNQKRCQNGSKGAAYNSPGAAYNDRSRLSGRKTHFLTAFCHLSATFLGTLGAQMHPDGPKIGSMAVEFEEKELQVIHIGQIVTCSAPTLVKVRHSPLKRFVWPSWGDLQNPFCGPFWLS